MVNLAALSIEAETFETIGDARRPARPNLDVSPIDEPIPVVGDVNQIRDLMGHFIEMGGVSAPKIAVNPTRQSFFYY